MANLNFKTALTGGGVAAVDRNTAGMKINGSICIATIGGTPNVTYVYKFDSSSLLTADGTLVIIPYGQSAGTAGRWILHGVSMSDEIAQLAQIAAKAPIASPTFTETPAAPTATLGTNTTQLATTAFVKREIPNQLNASGSAPIYACRAWVNFNGGGTVTIRGSGNVTSITDNGVGDYTVNFTTAMADRNYSVVGTSYQNVVTGYSFSVGISQTTAPTASAVRVLVINSQGTATDVAEVNIAIFR